MSVPTPHNTAKIGDFAKTVLMPGDPKRSEYIAKTYLENAVLELNNSSMAANLTKITKSKENKNYFQIVKAPKSGILTYTIDNKEDLQEKDISKETFANTEETETTEEKELTDEDKEFLDSLNSDDFVEEEPIKEVTKPKTEIKKVVISTETKKEPVKEEWEEVETSEKTETTEEDFNFDLDDDEDFFAD